MTALQLLAIGAGGFAGAVARQGLSQLIHRVLGAGFPYGTLGVNALGCFLLGVFVALAEEGRVASPHARPFLAIGLLGAFTTFSAFGLETLELLREGAWPKAAANALGNVGLGLFAVWLLSLIHI